MDMLHVSWCPKQRLLGNELKSIRKKESNRYSGVYHHPAKNDEDEGEEEEWKEEEETIEKAARLDK